MLPDGTPGPSLDVNNLQTVHDNFGMKCKLTLHQITGLYLINGFFIGSVDDKYDPYKGKSLFYHENGRSSNFYYDATFRPIFDVRPLLPQN